jgi:uncharacterized protein YndB with AHSA1/START domain
VQVEFDVSEVFQATPEELYQAWLDSEGHSAMTGGQAETSPESGAPFTAWDGYIQGRNLELTPPSRIVQAWRTTEFADSDPDSILEIRFEPVEEGTRLTIHHSQLPSHGTVYEQGWIDNYFIPMREYFQSDR